MLLNKTKDLKYLYKRDDIFLENMKIRYSAIPARLKYIEIDE